MNLVKIFWKDPFWETDTVCTVQYSNKESISAAELDNALMNNFYLKGFVFLNSKSKRYRLTLF
jgi:hypothetical protein